MSELEPLSGGRYELRGQLGVGGMAKVYSAWDTMLHVERAIKVLAPALVRSATIQQRFLTEARTMARLQHPHIVQVVDVGVDGARTFMVMELLEGGSLQDLLALTGPQPPHSAVHVCLAVLEALTVAHDAGIIHRDIKPQNILLARDGKPKLSDFGIAHVTDATRQLTKTGAVMGTVGFMAPEQRISARKVDGRADLYAVGTTLYACLTGQMPIELYASAFDEELMQGLPPALVPIIQTATRYKPDERYADARAMVAALRAALAAIPADTPASEMPEPVSTATMSFDDLDDLPAPPAGSPGLAVAPPSQQTTAPPPWTGGVTAEPAPVSGGTLDPSAEELGGEEPEEPKRSRGPLILGLVLLFSVGGGLALAGGVWVASMLEEPSVEVLDEPPVVSEEPEPEPEAVVEDGPAPVEVTRKRTTTKASSAEPVIEPVAEEPVVVEAEPEPAPEVGFDANALDGTWRGSCDGRELTLELNFMENNVVGGTSALYLAGVEVNVPVSGTYRLDGGGNGRIVLSGQRRISGAITLKGDVVGGSRMSGTMMVGQQERGAWSAERG